VPRLCEFYPGIYLTSEEKARKNLSQGKKNLSQSTVYMLPKHPNITKPKHTHTHPHDIKPTIHTPTHIHKHPQTYTHTHTIYVLKHGSPTFIWPRVTPIIVGWLAGHT